MKSKLSRSLPPLKALVSLRDDELARIDVGLLNLLCACGLPGAEDMDLFALLLKLDGWTDEVKHQIQRQWYQFLANPADYENSPGYFCILVLITVLQRDLGVRYNPERVKDPTFQDPHSVNPDFRDSRDLFIHGIVNGPGGTCSSMPVLYTAVARRLGFPVYLVEAKNHSYCRWDGQGQRFNIEGSGRGFGMYPDSHYDEWPLPLTDFDRTNGAYGKCLTPREELAGFLTTRGHCLLDNGRRDEAIECFRWSVDLAPHDKRYQAQFDSILNPNRGRLFIPPRNPYPAGAVVEVPCGSLPPVDLPWSVPVKYANAGARHGLLDQRARPGQIIKVAAGQPLPTCLPPGTPMQVVPVDQADDLSVFEAAARHPQALPNAGRSPQSAFGPNQVRSGISGPQRGPLLRLTGN